MGKIGLNLESIITIGEDAFAECTSLKKIALGKKLNKIEKNALGAPNLKVAHFLDDQYSKEKIKDGNVQFFSKDAPLTVYVYEDSSIHQYIKWWNENYEDNKITFEVVGRAVFCIGKDNWSIPNNWSIARDDRDEFDGKEGKESHPYIPIETFESVLESK